MLVLTAPGGMAIDLAAQEHRGQIRLTVPSQRLKIST